MMVGGEGIFDGVTRVPVAGIGVREACPLTIGILDWKIKSLNSSPNPAHKKTGSNLAGFSVLQAT